MHGQLTFQGQRETILAACWPKHVFEEEQSPECWTSIAHSSRECACEVWATNCVNS